MISLQGKRQQQTRKSQETTSFCFLDCISCRIHVYLLRDHRNVSWCITLRDKCSFHLSKHETWDSLSNFAQQRDSPLILSSNLHEEHQVSSEPNQALLSWRRLRWTSSRMNNWLLDNNPTKHTTNQVYHHCHNRNKSHTSFRSQDWITNEDHAAASFYPSLPAVDAEQ